LARKRRLFLGHDVVTPSKSEEKNITKQ